MTVSSIATMTLSGGRRVTVWRSETGFQKDYDTGDLFGSAVMNSTLPAAKLAEQLMKLDKVVAVEVIDGSGHGVRAQK